MNYKYLIQNLSKIQVGDVVIAKKDFTANDLDFAKSATSWFGRNILSSKNLDKSDLHRFKTNDVLYICTNTPVPELHCYNLEPIDIELIGYEYYVKGTMDSPNPNFLINFQTIKDKYNYSNFSTQIIALGLQEGYLEITPYKNLPIDIKNKIEIRFKINRIRYFLRGGVPLLLNNYMLIKNYKLTKQEIVFSGFKNNMKEHNIYYKKIKDILIHADGILDMVIGVTLDDSKFGTSVNGNPFDYSFD